MDTEKLQSHKIRNLLHTVAFIAAMSVLTAICASLLFGEGVWLWTLAGSAIAFVFLPEVPPRWVLKMFQAQVIHPSQAQQLYRIIQIISQRAQLDEIPSLYWVPSQTLNAFAVGTKADPAIAISDGLLRKLTQDELAGVLAHEISHIANNDLRLMNLADLLSRMTHLISLFGLLLVLFSIPLILLGVASISLMGLLILISAPTLSALLQFALSRVREFDADLEAVRLTGDPHGLASALYKIEQQETGIWRRLVFPAYKQTYPSLFRSHPDTKERIKRLLALQPEYQRDQRMAPWERQLISFPHAQIMRDSRHLKKFL
jgi:heat shock protein HtpX